MDERIQQILAKLSAGEALTEEENQILIDSQGGAGTGSGTTNQGISQEQLFENFQQANQLPTLLGDERSPNFGQAKSALDGLSRSDFARIEPKPAQIIDTTIDPNTPNIPGIPKDLQTSSDLIKLETAQADYTSFPGASIEDPTLEDNLSQAALMANFMGSGIDLNSSLHLLGKGIGDKNTALTVGAAGKTLLGGARSFLSGLSGAKRTQSTLDLAEEEQRKGLIGNFTEISQSNNDVGGRLFKYGGISKEERAFASDLSKFLAGGRKKKTTTYQGGGENFEVHMMYDPETGEGVLVNTYEEHLALQKRGFNHGEPTLKSGGKKKKKAKSSYQAGGESGGSYTPGDIITFKDEKGKVVSGVIKGVKDGEIILED